ncbi:hypothetical protein A2643_01670 [Candidatus Nomurabacteria bacterium RIFCSPHIGHO2_01_FULL_39_220]|uniref:Reverse transcriptase domain-containing protein n=1 Tax=Candidatus Nomurabacteria bacterium RIFCSPLOWO2_02_FULL_40_67 TaxID=1801787 RepID=A0A1F6Y7E5_9BACT|nr:MAG: Retron-type reverse transcriptase [Parcubacteria group bacterium GW2011_GWA2_40_37]KKS71603.1 MAG: Retron-type reverse transcriptase [Parcubacteria group bacterium GW2011_GWF2_42_7]OGI70538.1 MAG: hypothetical protein A2643_01670 [Candidatus Nomurabacteria bacterium RIFCSPHIGHO2_01_FULL_39_220]OGI71984.1 MAG: hypothetical protein A2W56_03060 [Candidatus Nomurabacteria bacterium RIFCSPHIGHO2_02_41_18]OGI79007.1 MAG: hypothetical protein A3C65_01220 [Candidatus Nomurabacteria bacterium RI
MNSEINISAWHREREGGDAAAKIFNFQNLYKAYISCRRHKRNTYHAAEFEVNYESELLKLEEELQDHNYKLGRSICFVVKEPSLREIFAATFRDRVVHHLLYNFLEPVFEPIFIDHSYACRKDKGIHESLKYLRLYLRKITKNYHRKAYFLHLDIKAFFMSLHKQTLFDLISKKIKNPELLWLTRIIIFNDPIKKFVSKGNRLLFKKIPPYKSLFHVPETQGLPIGNLTSQFFANVYLNKLDQFVKHKLKAKYYLRYVDDFMLISDSQKQLEEWRSAIILFLKEHLQLELNPKKQILEATDAGIDWLGYIVKPNHILIRRRIVKTLKKKLFQMNQMLEKYFCATANGQLLLSPFVKDPPLETIEKMLATTNAYFGHFQHADTFRLRTHLWQNRFGKLKDWIEPKDDTLECLQIKTDFLERVGRAGG